MSDRIDRMRVFTYPYRFKSGLGSIQFTVGWDTTIDEWPKIRRYLNRMMPHALAPTNEPKEAKDQ